MKPNVFAGKFVQGSLFYLGVHESVEAAMEHEGDARVIWTHDDLTGERKLLGELVCVNGMFRWYTKT